MSPSGLAVSDERRSRFFAHVMANPASALHESVGGASPAHLEG
jgi:hypothetical protein